LQIKTKNSSSRKQFYCLSAFLVSRDNRNGLYDANQLTFVKEPSEVTWFT